MFLCAFIPGIIAAIGYILAIAIYVRINKNAGPTNERVEWKQRFHLFKNIWHILLIFLVMIGGIYLGFFTPTEGAAVGAAGTGLIAVLNKKFNFFSFLDVVQSTAITSGMIFLVLLGAEFFNSFIALSQLPNILAELIVKHQLTPISCSKYINIVYSFRLSHG